MATTEAQDATINQMLRHLHTKIDGLLEKVTRMEGSPSSQRLRRPPGARRRILTPTTLWSSMPAGTPPPPLRHPCSTPGLESNDDDIRVVAKGLFASGPEEDLPGCSPVDVCLLPAKPPGSGAGNKRLGVRPPRQLHPLLIASIQQFIFYSPISDTVFQPNKLS